MTPWTLYWLSRLDGIVGMFEVLSFVSVVFSFVASVLWLLASVEDSYGSNVVAKVALRFLKFSAPLALVFGAGRVMVPTTKQMAAILVLPAIAQSEDVQEIGGDVVALAKQWLREQLPPEEASDE